MPCLFSKRAKRAFTTSTWYLGQHVQGSTRTTRKTLALEVEKQRRLSLERAYAGLPAEDPKQRVRTLQACIAAYVANLHCTASTETWTKERLAHVERLIGGVLLPVSEKPSKHICGHERRKALDRGHRIWRLTFSHGQSATRGKPCGQR